MIVIRHLPLYYTVYKYDDILYYSLCIFSYFCCGSYAFAAADQQNGV